MRLSKIRHEPLTRAIQCVPAPGHVQRRDGDEFAAIEADQRSINQFADLHHLVKRVDVDAIVMSRACPDDSPLADEILAVCRDAILASMSASVTVGDATVAK
jgi:hypothetical protein